MMPVRVAVAGDVEKIVCVHQEAFPGFFLTFLGGAFLTRFYTAVVAEPACISLVAEDHGSIVGFVVGPLHPAGFFRKLVTRSGAGFLKDAVPAFAKRPLYTARHLFRGLLYRGEVPLQYPGAALVSSIAVRAAAASSGVAGALLEAFCGQAVNRGLKFVYLTTDRDANEAANRFYAKHGFACDARIVRLDGRVMSRYVRALESIGTRQLHSTGAIDVSWE